MTIDELKAKLDDNKLTALSPARILYKGTEQDLKNSGYKHWADPIAEMWTKNEKLQLKWEKDNPL